LLHGPHLLAVAVTVTITVPVAVVVSTMTRRAEHGRRKEDECEEDRGEECAVELLYGSAPTALFSAVALGDGVRSIQRARTDALGTVLPSRRVRAAPRTPHA